MTQEQLAEILHVSSASVSQWENGTYRPSEEVRDNIEKVLGVRFPKIVADMENNKNLKIPELWEIKNINELKEYVDLIIDNTELDSVFEKSLKRILKEVLLLCLGYRLYYQERTIDEKIFKSQPQWIDVAGFVSSLTYGEDILDNTMNFTMPEVSSKNPMKRKILDMTDSIGIQYYEDSENAEDISLLMGSIAPLAESAGGELVNIIPEEENSFMSVLKISLLCMADLIYCQGDEYWRMLAEEEINEKYYGDSV